MCVISLIAFSLIWHFRGFEQDSTLILGLSAILGYLVFSISWYVMVRRSPYRYPWRRFISMVADLGIMTIFLHLCGRHVTGYYPIFLWIIIGNGIRFGKRPLIAAVITGAVGFGSLLIFNPFWQENVSMGIGLLMGVIILPVFFLTILHRLEAMQELKIQLAESKLADKAKDRFLATMSHEIRTPMNGILGMAEILGETELETEQRNHLHIITRSVESLLNIINDILDFSKITDNQLNLETVPFDLRQVMNDVVLLMRPTAAGQGVDLVFDYPENTRSYFLGDPTRVRQIVLNLVGNAIKFTDKGHVKLSAVIRESGSGNNISLTIEDTGIGIPEHRLGAVFDQFEQADNSTTRQYGGTGLGLAISRKLSNLMDGDIVAESEEGKGSIFTVNLSLPQCAPPVPETSQNPSEHFDFHLKALLAEDNKFNQVVVMNLLKRIGITVDIAENGAEALEMLEQDSYDLVFMDIRMPVMDGYTCAAKIRARRDHLADIPILALTAEATLPEVQKSLEAGMNLHLAKPIRVAEVVQALETLDLKPILVS